MKYRTIVADPPWPITMHMGAGGRRARATEVPYRMLTIDDIKALPVAALANNNCHLFLWSTRHLFREGIAAAIAREWGFEPKGEVIWGLRNAGMGGFLGNGHEPVLIASRGRSMFPPNLLPCGVQFWRQTYGVGKLHSAKPEAFLDWVEQISPGPYVELFARRHRLGWDVWGDESANTANWPEMSGVNGTQSQAGTLG